MDNNIKTRLAKAYRFGRYGEFVPRLGLWAVIFVSPLLVRSSLNDHDSWDKDSLIRALHGGYFWQDPTGFLFQQQFATLKGWHEYSGNQMAFLLTFYVLMVVTFAVLWLVAEAVRGALVNICLPANPITEVGLIPKVVRGRFMNASQLLKDRRDVRLRHYRQWVMLSVTLQRPSPHLVFTSATRRTVPLTISSHYEAVLEAAFLGSYHVYSAPNLFPIVPRILRPELMQYLLAVNATAIEFGGDQLHILVTNKALKNKQSLSEMIDAIQSLADQYERSLERYPESTHPGLLNPTVTARRTKTFQFRFFHFKAWWMWALFLVLFVSLPVEAITTRNGINGDDVMLQVVLQFIFFAFAAYEPWPRRLRLRNLSGVTHV